MSSSEQALRELQEILKTRDDEPRVPEYGEIQRSEEGPRTAVDEEEAKKEASLPPYILSEIRSLELVSFYHGMMARDTVERKLRKTGAFLVRATDNRDNGFEFILSVYNKKRTHSHLTMQRDHEKEKWFLPVLKTKQFKDIVAMIKYYRKKPIGTTLILAFANAKGKHMIPHDRVFYDPKKDLLGAGNFSSVYKGKLAMELGSVKVAVKYTKALDEMMDPEKNVNANKVKKEMIAEAQVMSQLRHANITQFFGMAADVMPVVIVIEFCQGGDLGRHLDERGTRLTYNERMLYIADAIAGLKYIHAMSITHRDIAARNCLICVNGYVKLSDFGMGSKLKKQENLLVTKKGAHCPARWMAPELIKFKKVVFTKPSDVWAMAILIYEIFANGQKPYWEVENAEVLKVVRAGKGPEVDPSIGQWMLQLTDQMFSLNPNERPTIDALYELFMSGIQTRNVLSPEMIDSLVINEIKGVKRLRLFHFDNYMPQVILYDDDGKDLGWHDAPDEILANVAWRARK